MAWEEFVQRHGEFSLMVWASWGLAMACYWGFGLLLLLLNIAQKPKWLYKYKIQEKVPFVPGGSKGNPPLRKLLINLVFNHICILLPGHLIMYYISKTPSLYSEIRVAVPIPGVVEIILHLVVFVLIEEIGFFYLHWLFHYTPLYTRFHKQHHEFHSPIALAATYVHPVEMVLANMIPVGFGPMVLQTHIVTFWIWTVIAIIGTEMHHSGFRFPYHASFDDQPDFHDYHHERFVGNYGLLGILDKIHGTDQAWVKKKRQSRGEG